MRRGQGEGTGVRPRELRFAAKWLYELCFWFSMPDETVATRPPWLDSSLPRRPCWGISVLRSTILQPLSSFAMRSCERTCRSRSQGMKPLTLWQNTAWDIFFYKIYFNCNKSVKIWLKLLKKAKKIIQ